jgi:hypothetical protein
MQTTDVRAQMIDSLRLDLVGPTGNLGNPNLTLAQRIEPVGLVYLWPVTG